MVTLLPPPADYLAETILLLQVAIQAAQLQELLVEEKMLFIQFGGGLFGQVNNPQSVCSLRAVWWRALSSTLCNGLLLLGLGCCSNHMDRSVQTFALPVKGFALLPQWLLLTRGSKERLVLSQAEFIVAPHLAAVWAHSDSSATWKASCRACG